MPEVLRFLLTPPLLTHTSLLNNQSVPLLGVAATNVPVSRRFLPYTLRHGKEDAPRSLVLADGSSVGRLAALRLITYPAVAVPVTDIPNPEVTVVVAVEASPTSLRFLRLFPLHT